jgi:hypothetical protein
MTYRFPWFNVSAEDSTNTFTFTVICGATQNAVSVTVPDGDYTIENLCAEITSKLNTSFAGLNLDGNGADTQTWELAVDKEQDPTSLDALRVANGRRALVFRLSNNNALLNALSITVTATKLSSMLGFTKTKNSSAATVANVATTTTTTFIGNAAYGFDVSYQKFRPFMVVRVGGLPEGSVQEDGKALLRPILTTIPLSTGGYGDIIFYEPAYDAGQQGLRGVGAGASAKSADIAFEWPDGTPVDFKNSTVSLELVIVQQSMQARF